MSGLGRDEAPISGRVWSAIDQTVSGIRTANGTARRFLPIDGPYGLGLTSVAGRERWMVPGTQGAPSDPKRWNVARPDPRPAGAEPGYVHGGTYLVSSEARPVPLIASEFYLGIRAVDAFEAGYQPLDLCAATSAARDVALEEERLLYYGSGPGDDALLMINESAENTTMVQIGSLFKDLQRAVYRLAWRGYAGPFALAVEPRIYTALYTPIQSNQQAGDAAQQTGITTPVLMVDLLRNLFRGGFFMVPAIDPAHDTPSYRVGAIVTVGSAYSRLVVGQDWVTTYRGRDGVLYRFLIMNSLQLRVCDPRSIQVLQVNAEDAGAAAWVRGDI
jgi:uncharacterized linocin/CFP29 family protein